MNTKLTICACRWRHLIPSERADALTAQSRAEGREVVIVDDLCDILERGEEKELRALAGTTIAACHERAVRSLLRWRGIETQEVINLREGTGDTGPGNDAWFPVIDKDRCTECGKCLDFCPFGVYELVDERLQAGDGTSGVRVSVVHPTHCKNNCPACARNCPSEAIIFPKYGRSPINGGMEHEESLQSDHSTLYADALRTRLIERRSHGTPLFKVEKQIR